MIPQLQMTAINNNTSQTVNFTQHTQQAHPNLQLQQQLHSQRAHNAAGNQNSLSNINNVHNVGG